MSDSRRPPSESEETLDDILEAPTHSERVEHDDDVPTDLDLGLKLKAVLEPRVVDPFAQTNEDGMKVAEVKRLIEETRDPNVTARRLIAPALPSAEPTPAPPSSTFRVERPPDQTAPVVRASTPRPTSPKPNRRLRLIFALNVLMLVLALFFAAWLLKDRDGKLDGTQVSSQR